MSPHERTLRDTLARAGRRWRLVGAARGATIGMGMATLIAGVALLAAWPLVTAVVIGGLVALGAAAVAMLRIPTRLTVIADEVEARSGTCRNLVRTAAEFIAHEQAVAPSYRVLVLEQAEQRLAALSLAQLFPSQRTLLLLAGASAAWLAIATLASPVGVAARREIAISRAVAPGAPIAIAAVTATVRSPSYAAVPVRTVRDPDRIEALVGSTVQLEVRSNASRVLLLRGGDVGGTTDTLALTGGDGRFRATVAVEHNGYLVLVARADTASAAAAASDPAAASRGAEARLLIGVTATPDEVPRVRITAPGRDLLLSDATRTIDIAVEATDDIGLASLRLRYTKVSGSGERFTFTEGELPLNVARSTSRAWRATARLALPALALEPGDMVVYRAAARDNRPDAPVIESDAFIVELLAPGGVAAEGFAVDPDQDRYAVSQQMVVLKTERLIARRSRMTADELLEASRDLAVEQRRVRAEFVFMMGGELAEEVTAENSMGDLDETHEAETESDLTAGRMQNQGRAALLAAIRAMSRATTQLNVAKLDEALVHERTAVKELEKAFSRTRYLLRAFSQREALDLTRRLSGNLTEASSTQRVVPRTLPGADVDRLRVALQQLRGVFDTPDAGQSEALRLGRIAEVVLAVDASSPALQRAAAQLSRAAEFTKRASPGAAQLRADSASVALSSLLREALGDAEGALPVPVDVRRLRGSGRAAGDAGRNR